MTELLASLALAFALGFGIAWVLRWRFTEARTSRVSVLALIPPVLLFAVFLVFFKGRPVGEDWLWLGVGLVYFWPWYLAWSLGAGTEALIRTLRRPGGG